MSSLQKKFTLKLNRKTSSLIDLVKAKLSARHIKLSSILNNVIEFLWEADWSTITEFLEFLSQRKWKSDNTLDIKTKMFLAKLKKYIIRYSNAMRQVGLPDGFKEHLLKEILVSIDQFMQEKQI